MLKMVRSSNRFQSGLIGLCLFGMLGGAEAVQAQYGNGSDGSGTPSLYPSLPLTVRPSQLKLGTENPKAGQHLLDSLDRFAVYVPAACAGKHRCPLVVYFHGGNWNGKRSVQWWNVVAERYGMLVYAPTARGDWWRTDKAAEDQRNVDRGLQQVLERFAVDTNKMALMAHSAGGGAAVSFGGYRLDLFSQVALPSTDFYIATVDPHNTKTRFLVTEGTGEGVRWVFMQGTALRQAGHPVEEWVGLRPHGMTREDLDVVGRWLHEGWTVAPKQRRAPVVVTKKVPKLTLASVEKLCIFWSRYTAEPESLRVTAREAYKRQVVMPFETNRPSLTALDIPALAARYPSVAADLAAAGLTAQEEERLLVAFVCAIVAQTASKPPVPSDTMDQRESGGKTPLPVSAHSVMAQNRDLSLANVETFGAVARILRSEAVWGTED